MDRVAVAVVGAGNVQCTPPVLATLAAYSGERPLDVCLFDADPERLELFDRLGRTFFAFTQSANGLVSTEDPDEAVAMASRVIIQADVNCAARTIQMRRPHSEAAYATALPILLGNISPTAEVLSLLPVTIELPLPRYRRLDWPRELSAAESVAVPHQSLRWIHGEEYPFDFFAANEDSPLKDWLDDPGSAALVEGTHSNEGPDGR